jgi:hypothetical protein
VLVADDIGPLAGHDPVALPARPFRRLSEATIRDEIVARSPELSEHEALALARVARGRLDRVDRLLDPEAARRREAVLEVARSVYRDPGSSPRRARTSSWASRRARARRRRSGRRRRTRSST